MSQTVSPSNLTSTDTLSSEVLKNYNLANFIFSHIYPIFFRRGKSPPTPALRCVLPSLLGALPLKPQIINKRICSGLTTFTFKVSIVRCEQIRLFTFRLCEKSPVALILAVLQFLLDLNKYILVIY